MKEGKGNKFNSSGNIARSNANSIQDESDLKLIELMKIEKNLDGETMGKNLEKINICRFYMALLSGIFSGTFSLTGLEGILFYFFLFIVFTGFLFFELQLKKGNHFTSQYMPLFHGMFPNFTVHLIFWVTFYNLVNIY